MFRIPAELNLLGIYFPPFLLICLLGLMLSVVITTALNKTGLSRLFWHPPLAFFAIWVLVSAMIGHLWISP